MAVPDAWRPIVIVATEVSHFVSHCVPVRAENLALDLMPYSHCKDFFWQREIQDQLEFQLQDRTQKPMVFEWEMSSVFTLARNLWEIFLAARKIHASVNRAWDRDFCFCSPSDCSSPLLQSPQRSAIVSQFVQKTLLWIWDRKILPRFSVCYVTVLPFFQSPKSQLFCHNKFCFTFRFELRYFCPHVVWTSKTRLKPKPKHATRLFWNTPAGGHCPQTICSTPQKSCSESGGEMSHSSGLLCDAAFYHRKQVVSGQANHTAGKLSLYAGADPGFWSGGPSGVLTTGGGNLAQNAQNCLKTAWFWNFETGQGAGPQVPLDPLVGNPRTDKGAYQRRGRGVIHAGVVPGPGRWRVCSLRRHGPRQCDSHFALLYQPRGLQIRAQSTQDAGCHACTNWNVFPLMLLACSVDNPIYINRPHLLVLRCTSRPASCVDWA